MNLQQLKAIQRSKLRKGVPFLLGGGGVLPSSRVRVCAAGWGLIFTTGLTTMGLHFLLELLE